MRTQWIVASLVAILSGSVGVSPALARPTPQQKCAVAKRKAAGKKLAAKLVCHAKPVLDQACLGKAEGKFATAFGKAGSLCPGDATSIEALVDACVDTFVADVPGTDRCSSAKRKGAGKTTNAELICTGKDLTKPGTEPGCSAGQDAKLAAAFTKAGGCPGDLPTAEDTVHECRDTIAGALLPMATTTTVTTTTSTSTSSTSVTTTSSTSSTSTSRTSTSVTTTSTTSTTSTTLAAVCGNHVVEAGETCDDGNTRDESDASVPTNPLDTCPRSCRIGPCPATATPQTATVSLTTPIGVGGVAGLALFVDYPDAKVSISGVGGAVAPSLGNFQSGSLSAPNDLDYGLLETLASTGSIVPGRLFTITFQTCTGAPPAQASDFTCLVKDASDSFGLPVVGTGCTVSVP